MSAVSRAYIKRYPVVERLRMSFNAGIDLTGFLGI
jgi:hypothetical protein